MSAPPNRFSSLVKEPVKKKQSDPKSNPPSDPKSNPPPEPAKSNRFNFTESEMQPQKKDQFTREDFTTRERPNFRDRVQFERDRRAADSAATAERKKLEIERSLTDAASFPELFPQQKPTTQPEALDLNFLEKVKWVESDKPIEWNSGLCILGNDDKEPPRKQQRPKTPYEIMSKQAELYETWKAGYIADYGEEYYERYYMFPNYDYEYFDKLDDKYEAELEELDRLEDEKERDQYIEYNTHYVNKNHYDE